MSISYGGDKITATDGGSLNPLSAIFRNRLIDAGFIINQRVYVSGTSLSSGTYAHDRWKAGSSGCTYTFTQGSAGVPITITITAGSLQQVIEGCNMPEGGTYVLSWEGTAQARFNGGTYGSSPLAVTGITAGANTTIEFNTGTVLKPQLEVGSSATGYEYRQYGTELSLCQRYYWQYTGISASGYTGMGAGGFISSTSFSAFIPYPVQMRATPTFTQANLQITTTGYPSVSSIGQNYSSQYAGRIDFNTSSSSAGYGGVLGAGGASTASYLTASAEL